MKNAWLYELRRADTNFTSYLFGTMHLVCEDRFTWPERLQEALKNCGVLYLETDLQNETEISWDFLSSFSSLRETLTNTQWQKLWELNETTLHYPNEELAHLHPFFILTQLQNQMFDCKVISPEEGLRAMALQYGLEVCGLESLEAHLGTIGQIEKHEHMSLLQDLLENYDELKKLFTELTDCYYNGDVDKMSDFFNDNSKLVLSKAAEEVFLIRRNKSWLPEIKKAAIKSPAFFAVGAAHLIGEHGLFLLLEKEGFTIRSI